ncbi:uncharacterized protein G2W53_005709 [Senna tora]|uniref:Uncharacterized protein n=1 Tax=Senna tora TaxID=362788 RepID=A0A835CFT9_9FABA|nr:uncharacterized protein G2W53_005709 [Senna tora]
MALREATISNGRQDLTKNYLSVEFGKRVHVTLSLMWKPSTSGT